MNSQKRMFAVLIAAILVIGASTLLTAKDNPMGIAPKQDITFTAPTVVGGSLLPAGDYKIVHEMQGTEHIMIFKSVNGKTEVKAKCSLVPLTEKAKTSEQRFSENAKNERVLVEMIFRGDTSKHVLVQ
jgi:hypothetical protein